MRKEYGRVLRQYFSKQMKERLPEFREEKVQSVYLWPGQRAFGRSVSGSLKCWIVLSPSPKDYDEFTVLVGWSTLGRYPELTVIPSPILPSPDRGEFRQAEYLTRLPQLWTHKDEWWVIQAFEPAFTVEQMTARLAPIPAPAAEAKVIPRVDDAIDKVIKIGIPYLSEFVKTREGSE
ncbi:MAG TPA: hypothetical protein PLU41_05455 [Acidobacteriota bacterium]|nr:hypothetical protein [Acidobacteriota bacterium]HQP73452.1 hypothetical protein [Acidobacteriota bacterium]